MKNIHFGNGDITTLILIKEDAIIQSDLLKYYINPLENKGLDKNNIAVYGLLYEDSKVKAELGKAYLRMLLSKIIKLKTVENIIVADTSYFKWLTKKTKVTDCYGETFTPKFDGYEKFKAVLVPNYKALFYNPNNQELITEGLTAITGFKKPNIIHSAQYVTDEKEACKLLNYLLVSTNALTIDIETTGLHLGSKLISIAFAWDKHNGVAIHFDSINQDILKRFFIDYEGIMIFHNALFDCKHLIHNLFSSVQEGLNTFENVEDSMLYTYLAKNSTTEAKLDLKSNALEFAGNYGVNVKDASALSVDVLLEYNLKDCLATWYVYNKYKAIVKKHNLLEPYTTIFQPSIKVLLKMMLTGLPLDNTKVLEVEKELTEKHDIHVKKISEYPEILKFNWAFRHKTMVEVNNQLKRKCRPYSDFMDLEFNPKSNNNIRELFYTQLGYEAIDFTETKQAATGSKTLKKLLNVAKEDSHKEILEHLIGIGQTSKILSTFIKAFKKYTINGFLHGSLKLGGTQSGRLSSSDPNLQNLPSNSIYGKAIKSCFVAPEGYLWASADFNSLEDRVNALLTKDPNKIKVYTDGYDGHSLRAYTYFKDQMPDIENTVDSINSIETKYPELRQKSKGPTFALTYSGTWHTLVSNIGIEKKEAQLIERNYHHLYSISDIFIQKNIDFAEKYGYMRCAFGMQIKCPLLAMTVHNTSLTPYAAVAEARSANNAVTQSWGMLINRALIATNNILEHSDMVYDIYPINTIHDAAYFLVKDDPMSVKFLNDTLIKEMQWNAHPSIASNEVTMEANLEIGKSWDKQFTLPNNANIEKIKEIINGI